jgi:hypothetical protein
MSTDYTIDASAFIHGWRRDYPPDVFPSVWDKLDTLAVSGRLISCEEVLLELERGGDELYRWAVDRRKIFHQPNLEVQKVVKKIVSKWPEFVPDESHDGVWADPYVIALGFVHKATVITGENPVGPNVCQHLGVSYNNLLGLLRLEDFSF